MSERIRRSFQKIDEATTIAEARILGPIARFFGLRVQLSRSQEERIQFLTNYFKEIIKRDGGIKDIKAVLGGDDGDLYEISKALVRSGVIRSPEISRIKINKVPVGPAPEEVRNSWLGAELLAVKLPSGSGPEFDFVNKRDIPARDAYAVLSKPAIETLKEKSPAAASWFEKNLPNDIWILTFGSDEVEVMPLTSE
ncbi:hypothetical protein A2Z22_00415 [Candidatus Woesebacteria bacterium RBG_16_34_12]|uniref:Uncharacterized protein n=1 Tax=Candidatus Woesebacteria bacterium RBG_16_34_12 TaxID=1802480 RepID=A0A1F7XAS2_9BACT|nr:MAG: hypothetical protein A2Z22_00415 [Candidatus Woesebacteria bacterium RBG_16_34_12]